MSTPAYRPNDTTGHNDVIVNVFGRTDVGRTREHNEDAFAVADLTADRATLLPEVRTHVCRERGTLFMVADGMGGAAAGEIASQMAVDIVIRELRDSWLTASAADGQTFARAIRRAASTANDEIHTFSMAHPEYRGMGTTATIAGLLGDIIYVAQVGDSRAYLVRDGETRQITKDQSLMQKLVEAGELTEEEAEQSERRNIILQALGPEPHVKIDLTHQRVRRGDILLLCSDGLSGQLSRDEIGAIVSGEEDLVQVCKQLIDRANEKGGPDNITVVVARFDGPGLSAATSEDEVGHRVLAIPDTGQSPAAQRPPLTPEEEDAAGRPTLEIDRRTIPSDVLAELDASGYASPPSARPAVSAARRGQGRLIAYVLLGALIILGGWYIFSTARRVVPRGDGDAPTAPAPAPAEPAR